MTFTILQKWLIDNSIDIREIPSVPVDNQENLLSKDNRRNWISVVCMRITALRKRRSHELDVERTNRVIKYNQDASCPSLCFCMAISTGISRTEFNFRSGWTNDELPNCVPLLFRQLCSSLSLQFWVGRLKCGIFNNWSTHCQAWIHLGKWPFTVSKICPYFRHCCFFSLEMALCPRR